MPIQPVASDCSRTAPSAQRLAAVDDGDVVQAEEAALEDVVALAVDLVDPPGEVDQQLVEAASPGRRGRPGRCGCGPCCRRARPPRRAPAGSGRRTPTRRPGSGRWGAGTARTAAPRAGPWRTRDRPGRAATQWKARSQAANQGYSHLSGMVMTRIELRCRQCWLRIAAPRRGRRAGRGCRRRARRRRRRGSSAWSRAGRRSACRWTSRSSSLAAGGWMRRVELVGLRPALRDDRVDLGQRVGQVRRVGQPQPERRPSRRAGRRRSGSAAPPWCRRWPG